jgi:hypothetical protein
MKINKKNKIVNSLGTYHRALETPSHIYFVNHEEGDENGCCKMYDRKMNLVSDNYFAYVGLTEDLTNGTYNWISKELKANVILHNEVTEKEYQYILK